MKYIYKIFFLVLLIPALSFGQSPKIDSLNHLLSNAPSDTTKIDLLLEIANYSKRQNIDSAIIIAHEALQQSSSIEDYVRVANANRQIGILFYIKGQYDDALEHFVASRDAWQTIDDLKGVSRANNNIGIIYKNQGQYSKAIEIYKNTETIQIELNDSDGLARTYNNIANSYRSIGSYSTSLDYSFKSLKIHETLNNKQEIATTYNNIGQIFSKQENYEKAIEYYEKCLKISNEIESDMDIFNSYNNIAEIYKEKKNADQALSYAQKGLELSLKIAYKKGTALSYSSIASIYAEMGNFNNSLIYYKKSLIIQEEIGNKSGAATANIGIGEFYMQENKHATAVKYLHKALDYAQETGSLQDISEASKRLSLSYEQLKQYPQAFEYQTLYKQIGDSLELQANVKKFTQLNMQHEFDNIQHQKELEQHQKDLLAEQELKQQYLISVFSIGGFVLIFIFAIYTLKNYREKQAANQLLSKQNKEITDSILYAERIQQAVLPTRKLFVSLIPDYFILFKPRDIVSGDFYWMAKHKNSIVITAADCTGHGVPGAFMSMLGLTFLNEIVSNAETLEADLILNDLRDNVINSLRQDDPNMETRDGMDMSLCVINLDTLGLQYAGAYNPLIHIRNNELFELKADKMPIGRHIRKNKPFTKKEIQLKKGDKLYLYSDGYTDQFGGEKGRKFQSKNFKQLLLEISNNPMDKQKELLNQTLTEWQGELEQLDDILVIGLTV